VEPLWAAQRLSASFGFTEGNARGVLVFSHTSLAATTYQGVIEGMGRWVKGRLEGFELVGVSIWDDQRGKSRHRGLEKQVNLVAPSELQSRHCGLEKQVEYK
jgi:hypothetical protein